MMPARRSLFLFAALLLWPTVVEAQMSGPEEFTFVRIRWRENGLRTFAFATNVPLWAHDYPTAEQNLSRALEIITSFRVADRTEVLTLDDPRIFEYPLLYMCEIGWLELSDAEVAGLREYLLRGGFLIIDDFRGPIEMRNFRNEMKRVLPNRRLRRLRRDHPIFHIFFDVEDLYRPGPNWHLIPEYYGIFDDKNRMMVLVNFNTDVGDGWEWPESLGDFSTESFELGINYLIYAFTH
jgi:hypothetical protein